jgi:hypothetical protein
MSEVCWRIILRSFCPFLYFLPLPLRGGEGEAVEHLTSICRSNTNSLFSLCPLVLIALASAYNPAPTGKTTATTTGGPPKSSISGRIFTDQARMYTPG